MTTLCDSYSESNATADWDLDNSMFALRSAGQSFTGNGGVLNSVKFNASKDTGATGNVYAYIYAHTGTYGTSSKPTGSPLATSNAFDISTLSTSKTLITLSFSGSEKITLSNGTKYVVVISNNNSGDIHIDYDSSGTHDGNACKEDEAFGYSWSYNSSYDTCFYVYTDDVEPTENVQKINIGDVWKTVEGMQINIGDVWKTVEGMQINIGDSWKTVF